MKEARFRYFKGQLTSQFQVEETTGGQVSRFGNLVLQPRYYLSDPQEINEETYNRALASRLSEDGIALQQSIVQFEGKDASSGFRIHPHVLQKGEACVEFEPAGGAPYAELVNEIYAEFPPSNPGEPYRGWQFIAQKDGMFHGRISGTAWCRVLQLDPEEKKQRLVAVSRKENLFSRAGSPGGLSPLLPAGGCNPVSLFTGGGCFSGGCSGLGCGLLSLLALLALLLFLIRSCNRESAQHISPRIVRDTVYVKEGMQVKEFEDSSRLSGTEVILLPNVQFYTNSARLLPYSIRPIQELAVFMDAHPGIQAIIKGHTDDVGEEAANRRLSQERAEAVRSVLISLGIAPERIKAVGYGESAPKVQGQTVEARALNRRVEVELINTGSGESPGPEKKGKRP
jgi:outer membrane protein OmpA-like peptidoglycan-associated protein